MTFPVKYFDSTQIGAPIMSGTAGALIATLDACLVNGFNLQILTSLTRSGSVATATVAAGHGYREGDIVLHAGANEAEYNGEFRIKAVTSTTYQFDVTGTPATPATGTISAKQAPVGWEKRFAGTNKAAYRSLDITSTRCCLRVDDTGTTGAIVRGYETLSDVDTGAGPFPTVAQAAAGLYWYKSEAADASVRRWVLVADDSLIYLFIDWRSYNPDRFEGYSFGDFDSLKPGDTYHCWLSAGVTPSGTAPGYDSAFYSVNLVSVQGGQYVARSYTQLGGAAPLRKSSQGPGPQMGASDNYFTYPSAVDNGLHLVPILLTEYDTQHRLRGRLPGVYAPLEAVPLSHLAKVDDLDGLPGRTVLAIALTRSGSQEGRCFMDITGPWR